MPTIERNMSKVMTKENRINFETISSCRFCQKLIAEDKVDNNILLSGFCLLFTISVF